MRFDSLGLHITNKCNMYCSHCITDASCCGNNIMSIEDIQFWIDSAKGFFHNICITGGEALLYPNLVRQGLELINANGFSSSLVSNCYWVHNSLQYKSILEMLNTCKLTKLAVSFDEFHDNSLFNVEDLEKLLSDHNRHFSIVVQPCYLSERDLQDKKENVEKLCQRYNCDFEPSIIVPFGRAKSIVPKSTCVSQTRMPCDVVKLPMIRYDGTFSACCGPAIGSPSFSPLIQYNAESSVFEKTKNDIIVNAIYLYGSRYLFDKLPDNMKQQVLTADHIGNVCGLCRAMLDQKIIVQYLYNVLEKEKWVILCSAERSIKNGGVT